MNRDWRVSHVARTIDGDSVDLMLTGELTEIVDCIGQRLETVRPWKCRVIIVDTPERNDPVGYAAAKRFTATWLGARQGSLRAETYGRDSFSRVLVDIYLDGDRGATLTQALLWAGYATYKP